MIEEISIRNLGVIGTTTLPLGPGFTALTGETGAGKTMVVTALGLLLGERSDAGAVRQGSDRAVVEGRWLVPDDGAVAERVRDAGGDVEAGELILGRSVSPEGRSRATVGGRGAPVGVLGELGQHLVVVHGQSDQIRLRSSTAQREALDRFAGAALTDVLGPYQDAFRAWRSHEEELTDLVAEQQARRREAALLRDAMAEIEAVNPQRGEDVELTERADRLSNLEDLRLAGAEAHEVLSTSDVGGAADAIGLVDTARRRLDRVADHDPLLAPVTEALANASFLLSDVAGQLASYLAGLDADGGRELEIVQERRSELTALSRKYGPTLDEVIDYLDAGSSRLLELESDTDRIDSLTVTVEEDAAAVRALAEQLTTVRRAKATELAEAVTAELSALAMADASLVVELEAKPELSMSGADRVSVLLRPHAGAEARPIGRGASGGELSRVMLAIEVVIAGTDPVPTFVFDEVDAGVGGAAAIEIGRRLARLAEQAQVIVVTHLAQVAAFATNHLRVAKDSDGAVTASSVSRLTGDDRIAEMARLLSGLPDSESGLAHARELVSTAAALSGS
ncbi:DNA repair protein RecN [Planctomonas psychrotolerans]|uniref:DNA repair protein RecN n=1 Tax=Planctomonas psychrotolerans TaxID=2528712 RepID=UPI00123957E1|nr:DNA repair protein RecN [Planctomonas psychrotolerans]